MDVKTNDYRCDALESDCWAAKSISARMIHWHAYSDLSD